MRYSKIYVLAPANRCSGGPELAHQLVDHLRSLKQDAYIVYMMQSLTISEEQVIPEPYIKYDIQTSNIIEDMTHNIVVIPETMFEFARQLKSANIACWWMSVDNFTKGYINNTPLMWRKEKNIFENFRKNTHIIMAHLPISQLDILYFLRKRKNTIQLYQSAYAKAYLEEHHFKRFYKLSDYINAELIPNEPINHLLKEDIVLYNPVKGLEFTERIIKSLPLVKFIPLQGLTREELNQLFNRAKLYVDFGNFPGKDRLPREAVVHDCCIITSTTGAAAFFDDVPIADEYKFANIKENLSAIIAKIKDIFLNYADRNKDFDTYRNIVKHEQQQFYHEIEEIFL